MNWNILLTLSKGSNTEAINKMRSALEARTEYVKEQTNVLQDLAGGQKH